MALGIVNCASLPALLQSMMFTSFQGVAFRINLAQCFRIIWRRVSELFGVYGVSLCRSQDCPAPLQRLHWR